MTKAEILALPLAKQPRIFRAEDTGEIIFVMANEPPEDATIIPGGLVETLFLQVGEATYTNEQKMQLAKNLGFETFSSLALANAGIGVIGIPFFNTTTYKYESTTDTE